MGEGIGNEAQLMPFINSANIACGFHAGDVMTMQHTIALCLQYKVNIGAHPSFPDRENFGRTAMQLSAEEIYQLIAKQLLVINKVATTCDAKLHHVKPHGALYNMAAKDAGIAKAIAQAVKDFDASLICYGLSGSVMNTEANKMGLQTLDEVFADRTYQSDGSLTPRTQPNALLLEKDAVIKQVLQMVQHNEVTTISGENIFIKAGTVCIHGDGAHAVDFAKAIHHTLYEQ
jgi:5-oxoprolinase (ATP-hydrolysing) subunit A